MKTKCVGLDWWGDLYLYGCTGNNSQSFSLNPNNGQLVVHGGRYAGQCLLADGWFWPKFRPCTSAANMKWAFENNTLMTQDGSKCLKYDLSWTGSNDRLNVGDCSSTDNIWLYVEAETTVPSAVPTAVPSVSPSLHPSVTPSAAPTALPTAGPREEPLRVKATDYDEQRGTQGVSIGGVSVVGYFDNNDYVTYKLNFGLSGTYKRIKFHYARRTAGGRIEIRLGGPSGQKIGQFVTKDTGGWGNFITETIDLGVQDISGYQDLTFRGVGTYGLWNLKWFELAP